MEHNSVSQIAGQGGQTAQIITTNEGEYYIKTIDLSEEDLNNEQIQLSIVGLEDTTGQVLIINADPEPETNQVVGDVLLTSANNNNQPDESSEGKSADSSLSFVMSSICSDVPSTTANTINVSIMPGLVCQLQRYMYTPGLCRVCLVVQNDLVSIFEDVNITSNGLIENTRGPHSARRYNIIPAISQLLDIEVKYGDGLPDHICLQCLDNLLSFSVFRKRISIAHAKLNEILAQVEGSDNPTVIPELGEVDMKKTDIFRHTERIIQAKKLLKNSSYSHVVVRSISDRVWEKVFHSLSLIVGVKSGKLKSLECYALDPPHTTGWLCQPCNITVHGSKEKFGRHVVETHAAKSLNEVLFPCDLCSLSFTISDSTGSLQTYGEHWLQHFFFFECDDCNKKLPSQKGLWIHKRSAHSDRDKLFQCSKCDKAFKKKPHLNAHLKTHLNLIDTT